MSEAVTQTTDAPAAPAAPAPAPASASGGGVPTGLVPQAEAEQAEQRRRATQSALDQEKARNQQLEQRLAALETQQAQFDPVAVADQFTARFNQQQSIAQARVNAKQEYPLARDTVLAAQFQTPEELVAAVKQSHDQENAYRESVRSTVLGEVAADLREKHGITLETAPQTPVEGVQPTGAEQPQAESFRTMSVTDLANVPDDQLPPALR